jgi:hypothetical protein
MFNSAPVGWPRPSTGCLFQEAFMTQKTAVPNPLATYTAALRQLRDQATAQFVARAEMIEAVLTALVASEHVFVYGASTTRATGRFGTTSIALISRVSFRLRRCLRDTKSSKSGWA